MNSSEEYKDYFEHITEKASLHSNNESCLSIECQEFTGFSLESFSQERPAEFLSACKSIDTELAQLLIEHAILRRRQSDIAKLHRIAQPTVSVLLQKAVQQLADPQRKIRQKRRLRTPEHISYGRPAFSDTVSDNMKNPFPQEYGKGFGLWFALEPANNFDVRLLPVAIRKVVPSAEVFLPLSPSGNCETYCYVRCDYANFKRLVPRLKRTKYIRHAVLDCDGAEIAIPNEEVQAMRTRYESNRPIVAEGDFVRIVNGIASELCGHVAQVAEDVATVVVELLTGKVAVTLPVADVAVVNANEDSQVFYFCDSIQDVRPYDLLRRERWLPKWFEWIRPVLAGEVAA